MDGEQNWEVAAVLGIGSQVTLLSALVLAICCRLGVLDDRTVVLGVMAFGLGLVVVAGVFFARYLRRS